MKSISTKDRLRYAFDKSMAKGPIALMGWLALVSLLVILVASLVISLVGIQQDEGGHVGFIDAAWTSLMHSLDAGNVAGDTGWGFRGVMFLVTLAGIFIVSSLIGILGSGIEAQLENLRKGRSFVIEQDHT